MWRVVGLPQKWCDSDFIFIPICRKNVSQDSDLPQAGHTTSCGGLLGSTQGVVCAGVVPHVPTAPSLQRSRTGVSGRADPRSGALRDEKLRHFLENGRTFFRAGTYIWNPF